MYIIMYDTLGELSLCIYLLCASMNVKRKSFERGAGGG